MNCPWRRFRRLLPASGRFAPNSLLEKLGTRHASDPGMRSNLITTLLLDLDLVFGSMIWPMRRWARRLGNGG
jgi:hypothetical protein